MELPRLMYLTAYFAQYLNTAPLQPVEKNKPRGT